MAFPYADRDYSLYSTSSNEASVGRAQHDLNRCAQILNEVLDNGAGILDGVKKRKTESPNKESINLHKKLRQTNKIYLSNEKIASSTPQQTSMTKARRQRSASTSSACSYGPRTVRQKRCRSLSEQRSASACGRNRSRDFRSSSEIRAHSTNRNRILDSVNSVLANQSATSSEADTLTGVHLDNSSQFGIPPVFNARGERRSRQKAGRLKSRQTNIVSHKGNMGWLKPQATISTQTCENKENVKHSIKKRTKKLALKTSSESEIQKCSPLNNATKPVTASQSMLPKANTEMLKSSSSLCKQKEHDIDELVETTLTEDPLKDDVITQIGADNNSRSPRHNSKVLLDNQCEVLMQRLKTASHIEDRAALNTELNLISYEMPRILRGYTKHPQHSAGTGIDQLLLPFQKESKELKEQVKELKAQLYSLRSNKHVSADRGGNKLSCDLSLQVVAAETRNTQLSNQLAEVVSHLDREKERVCQLTSDLTNQSLQVEKLKKENRQLHTDLGSRTSKQSSGDGGCVTKDSSSRKLQSLQQSMRLIHTMLTDVAAHCELDTAKHISPILELCSRRVIESMGDPLPQPTLRNLNNNGRWENKPDDLVELVSANLTRARTAAAKTGSWVEQGTGSKLDNLVTDSRYSMTQYFEKYHPHLALSPTKEQELSARPSPQPSPCKPAVISPGLDKPCRPRSNLPSSAVEMEALPHDPLHSTLISEDSTLTGFDLSCSDSVSTMSMATTMAENAFQEGLAKLDANIARLHDSLKTSRLGSTL